MCGIAGIIHQQAADFIEGLSELIAHRGPDGKGTYLGEGIALAHRRLAIQDLHERAAQPMYSQDEKYIIILNGEIYNHWEIRKEFLPEINFITTSDTETLLYGYIKYGKTILDKLNGIFAFAIYAVDTKELFIARDHLGVNPLYFYLDDSVFLFSSEIKSFLAYPEFNKQTDYRSLLHYISFLYSPGPTTPFKKVKKLDAGHYITVLVNDVKTLKVTKYYEIPFSGKYSRDSETQLIDELDRRLSLAVKRQLLSDVPVGFFLSGGLDSSLIVAMAKKVLPGQRLKCFTIDDMSKDGSEGFVKDLPFAQRVAEYLDVDLEVIKADIDIIRDFDKMVWHLDEPQADAAPLNVWNICRKARSQGYIVLLGGTGGDDVFSGYRRHQMLHYQKVLSRIPQTSFAFLRSILSMASLHNSGIRRLRKMTEAYADFPKNGRSASYYLWLSSRLVKSLFQKEVQEENKSYQPEAILLNSLQNIPEEKNPLNQMLYWDLKYFLPDHNLNYTNKMGMAHGVEIRVPFLDKELVEFSTTIPPHLKMKELITKYILKKVAERYLPHDVIYRSKTGFGAPVRSWIIKDLNKQIRDYFGGRDCQQQGLFDCESVLNLVEDNRKGKIDASYPILAILAIKSWYAQFVERTMIMDKTEVLLNK